MEAGTNPFKFVDVIRSPTKGILVKYQVNNQLGLTTIDSLLKRINQFRSQNTPEYEYGEELKALSEYEREAERDNWHEGEDISFE